MSMVQHELELEIKTLLGSQGNAQKLKQRMLEIDPVCHKVASNRQLNHYFVDGDRDSLERTFLPIISQENKGRFLKILHDGKDLSIRTRQSDDAVFFIIKASIDDTTSANGTARIEFEEQLHGLSLEQLDAKVLEAGCAYQAKWSREREEYAYKDAHVCIDKNAGYGYLAEFERVVDEGSVDVEQAKQDLRDMIVDLGLEELPQDRLERMFAHYNNHWPEYYGTDKTFVVE